MKSSAATVQEYLDTLDPKWKDAVFKLRDVVKKNIPAGFEETMSYGMIGYVVPRSLYPKGYLSNPKEPLPFINIAAQKNHVALYHMGLYGHQNLKDWFVAEYEKSMKKKIDAGGACIRFKKAEDIPFDLIAELVRKIDVRKYIALYEEGHGKQRG
jgi:uncharacterized protein YdhG (YjbR/CyaY superfamily)